MNDPQQNAERLRDLLADQALFELSAEEQAELRALLGESNVNPESFEWTAATGFRRAQPRSVRAAPRASSARRSLPPRLQHQAAAQLIAEAEARHACERAGAPRGIRFAKPLAWFAAAACFFVAFMLWSGSHPAPSAARHGRPSSRLGTQASPNA